MTTDMDVGGSKFPEHEHYDDHLDELLDTGDDEEEEFDWDNLKDFDDNLDFVEPGGKSALRAATPRNPRIYPCPTCEEPNRLTWEDVGHGYQCNECADRVGGGGW